MKGGPGYVGAGATRPGRFAPAPLHCRRATHDRTRGSRVVPQTAGPLQGVAPSSQSRPRGPLLHAAARRRVIKIERPGAGDDTRAWGPPFAGGESARYPLSINRNKESVTLNSSTPADASCSTTSSHGADVLVENFRPGTRHMGYADRARQRSTRRFRGLGRPDRHPLFFAGYDAVIAGEGGMMSITGPADGLRCNKVGVAIADVWRADSCRAGDAPGVVCGASAGRGQHIDVALGLIAALSRDVSGGHLLRHPGAPPSALRECASPRGSV